MEARRVNFTYGELEALVACLMERQDLVTKKLGGQYKNLAQVRKEWEQVAAKVSACGTGCARSGFEVKKKWADLKHRTKKKAAIIKEQQEMAGANSSYCSGLSPIEQSVVLLLHKTWMNGSSSDTPYSSVCITIKREATDDQDEQHEGLLPSSENASIQSIHGSINEDSSHYDICSIPSNTRSHNVHEGETLNSRLEIPYIHSVEIVEPQPSSVTDEILKNRGENGIINVHSIPSTSMSQNVFEEETRSHLDTPYIHPVEVDESAPSSFPEEISKNPKENDQKSTSTTRVRRWRKLRYKKQLQQNDDDVKTLINLKRRKLEVQEKSFQLFQSIATSLQSLETTCQDMSSTFTKLAKIGCALGGLDYENI